MADAEPTAARKPGPRPGTLPTRLVWFAALWIAGVAAVGLIALLIRSALF